LYKPSEDSYLLADSIKAYKGNLALEIGVGSGEVLKVLCQRFRSVIGTDIDFKSLQYCRITLPSNAALICCDAASSLSCRFDLILSNPPYLPVEDSEDLDSTIHGGRRGTETTIHFLESSVTVLAENGKVIVISSNISDYDNLLYHIGKLGLRSRVLRKYKLFFETLIVLEIGF
jgi:release factor glutamine methyltransferase